MSYCSKCGSQINEDDTFCPQCGAEIKSNQQNSNEGIDESTENTIRLIAFIFMVVSTVCAAPAIFTLIWMVPMTYHYYKSYKSHTKLSLAFKISSLIFVNIVSGILMLVDTDSTL